MESDVNHYQGYKDRADDYRNISGLTVVVLDFGAKHFFDGH